MTHPRLPTIQINNPCPLSWAAMSGNDQVRHCTECEKNVTDLSQMTSHGVRELLRQNGNSGMCVRLHRDDDGQIITKDHKPRARRRLTTRPLMRAASFFFVLLGFASCRDGAADTPRTTTDPVSTDPAPVEPTPECVMGRIYIPEDEITELPTDDA